MRWTGIVLSGTFELIPVAICQQKAKPKRSIVTKIITGVIIVSMTEKKRRKNKRVTKSHNICD